MELAAVLLQRPRDDDALLALLGEPADLRGHAAEHDLTPARTAHRVGTCAVDCGPDDLGRDLLRHPRRRLKLATLDLADMDAQAVPVPIAAREAFGERVALEVDVTQRGSLGLGHGDRIRRLQGGSGGSGLGHERLPVQEQHALLLLGHRQRPIERRG